MTERLCSVRIHPKENLENHISRATKHKVKTIEHQ